MSTKDQALGRALDGFQRIADQQGRWNNGMWAANIARHCAKTLREAFAIDTSGQRVEASADGEHVNDECCSIPPMTDEGLAKRAFDAACPPQPTQEGGAAMTTEEYQIGYSDGYDKGWNEAIDDERDKPSEVDQLIRRLGFDPEQFRKANWSIDHENLRAAILHPEDYEGLREGGAA